MNVESQQPSINELITTTQFVPAVVAFLVRDQQVLLGFRKRVSLGLGKNLIAGIGGKVGDQTGLEDETHEEALKRELLEEIGVTPTKYSHSGRVRFLFPHKPKWQQDVQIYLVYEWDGNPKETDVIRPEWFLISDIPEQRMWDDNRYWVPKVLRGGQIDGVFLYNSDNIVTEQVFY